MRKKERKELLASAVSSSTVNKTRQKIKKSEKERFQLDSNFRLEETSRISNNLLRVRDDDDWEKGYNNNNNN